MFPRSKKLGLLMRSFEEYHNEYLKTHSIGYNQQPIDNSTSYNFKFFLHFIKINFCNYKVFILLIPLIFTFSVDLLLPEKKKEFNHLIEPHQDIVRALPKNNLELRSSTINNIYSEKIIETEDVVDYKIPFSVKPLLSPLSLGKIEDSKIYSDNLFKENKEKLLDLESDKWKKNYSSKKINFIETLLPIIVYENTKILIERKRLIEIKNFIEKNKTLNTFDIVYLESISKKYSTETHNKHKIDLINELLHFVNVIPNSIVLAQAANESGWGSSRFAKEHNALFGQYTYNEKEGVIPYKREEGKKHLIKNFESIDKSVESYLININTHHAYKKFRDIRKRIYLKKIDFNYSIKSLTQALDVYAEDESYVKTINSIIDTNNLTQFDLINLTFTSS